ncbi:phage holin [Salibacterium sp. K-3]
MSFIFSGVTAVIAWWKNNNFSAAAKQAQNNLDSI